MKVTRRGFVSGGALAASSAVLPPALAQMAKPESKVSSLTFGPLPLTLRHAWTLSRNTSTEKKNGLLTLTADGVTGYGEAAANVRYKQSYDSAEAAFARVKEAVAGLSPWEHLAWIERAEKAAGDDSEVVAALDIALWDWKGKKVGRPVHELLGMPRDRMAITTFSISIDTPEVMKQKVKEAEIYPVLKIKVGLPGDEENIAAIRSVTKKPLRVDPNEGWTADEAIRKLKWMKEQGVELCEQPIPSSKNEEMRKVKAASPMPLIADESVLHAKDAAALVGLFDGINIKLQKCGGITRGYELAALGRALGFTLMMGCMIESSVGIAAGVAVAPLFDILDLDGNLLVSNDPFKGLVMTNGRWKLPDAPGLGVVKV